MQNVTLHPALHSTRTPISDAIDRLGTICPVSITGSPGIVMSQQCDNLIFDLSGRLITSGLVATRLLSTGVPSMMKIAVSPVSMIACVIFCRLSCPGAPKRLRAVAAIVFRGTVWARLPLLLLRQLLNAFVVFDALIVMSSSSTYICVLFV